MRIFKHLLYLVFYALIFSACGKKSVRKDFSKQLLWVPKDAFLIVQNPNAKDYANKFSKHKFSKIHRDVSVVSFFQRAKNAFNDKDDKGLELLHKVLKVSGKISDLFEKADGEFGFYMRFGNKGSGKVSFADLRLGALLEGVDEDSWVEALDELRGELDGGKLKRRNIGGADCECLELEVLPTALCWTLADYGGRSSGAFASADEMPSLLENLAQAKKDTSIHASEDFGKLREALKKERLDSGFYFLAGGLIDVLANLEFRGGKFGQFLPDQFRLEDILSKLALDKVVGFVSGHELEGKNSKSQSVILSSKEGIFKILAKSASQQDFYSTLDTLPPDVATCSSVNIDLQAASGHFFELLEDIFALKKGQLSNISRLFLGFDIAEDLPASLGDGLMFARSAEGGDDFSSESLLLFGVKDEQKFADILNNLLKQYKLDSLLKKRKVGAYEVSEMKNLAGDKSAFKTFRFCQVENNFVVSFGSGKIFENYLQVSEKSGESLAASLEQEMRTALKSLPKGVYSYEYTNWPRQIHSLIGETMNKQNKKTQNLPDEELFKKYFGKSLSYTEIVEKGFETRSFYFGK